MKRDPWVEQFRFRDPRWVDDWTKLYTVLEVFSLFRFSTPADMDGMAVSLGRASRHYRGEDPAKLSDLWPYLTRRERNTLAQAYMAGVDVVWHAIWGVEP